MNALEELSPQDRMIVRDVMESHGYTELTETQNLAFTDGVLSDGNHLLVAETGNGKTLCAEAVTKKQLEDGNQVAYLVPSRQLVRDKRDTVREWADEYDIRSGKQKYHDADVAVATFASFYRAILQGIGNARNFDLVVLDDFHEIYGTFLGPEIEKSIAAALYEDIEIFAMSATIGNPSKIGDWLNAEVTVSPEGRQIDIDESVVHYDGGSKKQTLADFVSKNNEQGPFLVFNFAKSWTESRAEAIADTGAFESMSSDNDHVSEIESRIDGEISSKLETLASLLSKGVGYHHSDLPNGVKNYIEDLYYENKLGCLCATTTIAYGFDAPVKSVVVADIKRRGEWVGVWEYQQWIGRAARPGYGYTKGYSYTITRYGDSVQDRYFEPRQLEPVETHIERDASFRKLVLELVATGWNTPEELESFVKNSLYWTQLADAGSWGGGASDQLLKDKLQTTLHWLEQNGFVTEQPAQQQFATKSLGSGAVEFLFDTFGSTTLTDIKQFDDWLTQTDTVERIDLVSTVADEFGPSLSASDITSEFEQKLITQDYNPSDSVVTACIIDWYWVQNRPSDAIESETGVDSSYLYSTAGRLADTIEATLNLFATNTSASAPSWFNSYVTQIDRGIRAGEVPLVETINGLGRYRVRKLREYVTDTSVDVISRIDTEGSLPEILKRLYAEIGDETQFKDALRTVNGIGPATADAILEFVETRDESPEINSLSPEPTEKTEGETLDDWV